MRKTICLFVVAAGLTLTACTDKELAHRMERPPVDATAALIVTFGAIGALLALRRGVER